MQEGWSAKGRLEPLWLRLDPPKGDTLAELTGINVKTLYGYNSGSLKLGERNAVKIARATGATLYDLGKPMPLDWNFAMSILGQTVGEIERRAPETPPDRLREWAVELHRLAWTLEEVADARGADELPS